MDTVISEDNFHLFKNQGIIPVLPRIPNPTSEWVDHNHFLSYSLTDFERLFLRERIVVPSEGRILALIDIANGHMLDLYEAAKKAKIMYGEDMCLMVGNVANPSTFHKYCEIGVDMVRIGIGNGGGCLTTVQTGVGYPMASLIKECGDIQKKKFYLGNSKPYETKIVADGGFKKYSDIIKALALGADYVMLGSILNKCLESAGETSKENYEVINQYTKHTNEMFMADVALYKNFRGMSTKEVQKSWGKESLTTSEGVVRRNKVEYTIEGWAKNFEDYLKSAMSYAGKKELHQFIGGAQMNFISRNAYKRFDK
jgi:NAD(P)H-dependent flavin oxidoreductase YrpB (nitropropane dioxygenase family)